MMKPPNTSATSPREGIDILRNNTNTNSTQQIRHNSRHYSTSMNAFLWLEFLNRELYLFSSYGQQKNLPWKANWSWISASRCFCLKVYSAIGVIHRFNCPLEKHGLQGTLFWHWIPMKYLCLIASCSLYLLRFPHWQFCLKFHGKDSDLTYSKAPVGTYGIM